ncbi:MAG: hypothetical protein GH144_02630 [Clostridia bacterium]|jgi:hypothetical protein|nr:hypothetical protein [Clostridia bacterium]
MEEIATRQINFREEVDPLTGLEVDKVCPITGTIKSVTMSWPPGCNNLVEVAFGHSGQKVCPSTEYIALDSATPTFDGIEEPVEREERLWVEILNGDDTYPHTISVLVVITGKLGGE